MAEEQNPYKPILEIKEGNEVFRIHRNYTNNKMIFLTFGAEVGDKSNMYELSLSDKNISDIIKALS